MRSRIDADTTREVADAAAERCREYTRKRGFIDAGELRPLDPTFVAAVELQHVGAHLARELRSGDPAERYFYELLGGADDGDRPAVDEVPSALRVPYGLAMSAAVDSISATCGRIWTPIRNRPHDSSPVGFATIESGSRRWTAMSTPRTRTASSMQRGTLKLVDSLRRKERLRQS